jgi:hypothetical protein
MKLNSTGDNLIIGFDDNTIEFWNVTLPNASSMIKHIKVGLS